MTKEREQHCAAVELAGLDPWERIGRLEPHRTGAV